MTFFNTWVVPGVLLCLMVLWIWMEIRDRIRREDADLQRERVRIAIERQIRILGLRCDALSKAVDPAAPKVPAGPEFTCPDCGSHHYVKGSDEDGYCHGYVDGGRKACGFTWNKVDDHLYFKVLP